MQDSVLRTVFKNIMYNYVLNLPIPEEATDITLAVVAKHLEYAESYTCETISAARAHLGSSGLTLTGEKRSIGKDADSASIQT